MIIFAGFPDVRTGPRATQKPLPMHYYSNGSPGALDLEALRKYLLGIRDLTSRWNSDRTFISRAEPIILPSARDRERPDKQILSLESSIIETVRAIRCR